MSLSIKLTHQPYSNVETGKNRRERHCAPLPGQVRYTDGRAACYSSSVAAAFESAYKYALFTLCLSRTWDRFFYGLKCEHSRALICAAKVSV